MNSISNSNESIKDGVLLLSSGKLKISNLGIFFEGEGEGMKVRFEIFKTPDIATFGVLNDCFDGYYILFMDYDNIKEEEMIVNLNFLASKYNLSHFLVIKTGEKSWHAINFQKFSLSALRQILADSLCDYTYKNAIKIDKGWVLRIGTKISLKDGLVVKEKPEYFKFLKYDNECRAFCSRPHLELYMRMFDEFAKEKDFFKMLDNNHKLKVIKYGSVSSSFISSFNLKPFVLSKKIEIEEASLNDSGRTF